MVDNQAISPKLSDRGANVSGEYEPVADVPRVPFSHTCSGAKENTPGADNSSGVVESAPSASESSGGVEFAPTIPVLPSSVETFGLAHATTKGKYDTIPIVPKAMVGWGKANMKGEKPDIKVETTHKSIIKDATVACESLAQPPRRTIRRASLSSVGLNLLCNGYAMFS
jgi:hypothetical protein